MIVSEYVYGQIDIHFKCGCEAIIGWSYRDDPITGIENEIRPEDFSPCNSHSYICYPELFDWRTILNSILEEQEKIENYHELFEDHDQISTKHDLDYYIDYSTSKDFKLSDEMPEEI